MGHPGQIPGAVFEKIPNRPFGSYYFKWYFLFSFFLSKTGQVGHQVIGLKNKAQVAPTAFLPFLGMDLMSSRSVLPVLSLSFRVSLKFYFQDLSCCENQKTVLTYRIFSFSRAGRIPASPFPPSIPFLPGRIPNPWPASFASWKREIWF